MTLPRRVVPGTTYQLTRRTLDRRFYLQPSPELNRVYEYALAFAAEKHGVGVHGFGCMSNHSHDTVTDWRGVLPDFMRDFHRELAMGVKALYGISENVWAAGKPSAVELVGEAAQLEAVLYATLNPVTAGLVPRASEWPGAISLPRTRRIHATRPAVWFSGDRPEVITLEITPPPAWTGTADEWHDWLETEVARREEEIAKERRARNKPFLGRRRVLAQRPFDRPRNADVLPPKRNPTLKTGRDGSLMQSASGQLRAWRRAYRDARERWTLDKTAVFPRGTWWVVQRAGAAFG